MIKIGHARYDERKKSSGGAKGDSTGKEVCIAEWYERPSGQAWKVLRHPDVNVREKMARFVEEICKGNLVGYDQGERNTLHAELLRTGYDISKIKPCECDCSSFMTAAAIYGGVSALEYKGNAPTTSTMEKAFTKAGFKLLSGAGYADTDSNLIRGDILFCAGHHTLMALEDGSGFPTLRKGSKGNAVKVWQMLLGIEADGIFGSETEKAVKEHQTFLGLNPDGIIGKNTWEYGFKILL